MTQPMQPPMTDERLDRLIRELLIERAEDVAAAAVSADAMAERIATRRRPVAFGRTWVLLAAATMLAALLIGGAVIVGGQPRLPSLPSPPSLPPPPSAAQGAVVHGWPDTDTNAPGVYSWDGSRCAGQFCSIGFMHNGYGSGDVEIRLEVAPEETISGNGATPVVVAGHDGIYRRIDAGQQEWIVAIERRTLAIRLTARPGTSEADLADAHAIIGSMRYESTDNPAGFRLIFTLTTNEWDSG